MHCTLFHIIQAFFLIISLVTFLIINIKCSGCKRQFATHGSCATHQRRCPVLLQGCKQIFRQHEENVQKIALAKLARIKSTQEAELHAKRQEIRERLDFIDMESGKDGNHARRSLSLQTPADTEPSILVEVSKLLSLLVLAYKVIQAPKRSLSPPLRSSGRPARKIQLPKHYQDVLPPAPPYIPMLHTLNEELKDPPSQPSMSQLLVSQEALPSFWTESDGYGVIRIYSYGRPSWTPDQSATLDDVADSPYLALNPHPDEPPQTFFQSVVQKIVHTALSTQQSFAPFPNISIYLEL